MATLRQFTEGYYQDGLQHPSSAAERGIVTDLVEDLERRMTVKLFDANRTLTSMVAEARQTVEIDCIHEEVFRQTIGRRIGDRRAATVNTLDHLVSILPAHALVRRHPKLDFCLIAPVMRCKHPISNGVFSALSAPLQPETPDFRCDPGELFLPLAESTRDKRYVHVVSPYPGPGPAINKEAYKRVQVSAGGKTLVFPPEDRSRQIELVAVKKGDPGCAVEKGKVKVGDAILCRGQIFRVKSVVDGGRPDELYGGRDLVVMTASFAFNARRAVAFLCPPVMIKAKSGVLPYSVLEEYQPVKIKYSCPRQVKRMGSLKLTFSSIAFNKFSVCHRDSYV